MRETLANAAEESGGSLGSLRAPIQLVHYFNSSGHQTYMLLGLFKEDGQIAATAWWFSALKNFVFSGRIDTIGWQTTT